LWEKWPFQAPEHWKGSEEAAISAPGAEFRLLSSECVVTLRPVSCPRQGGKVVTKNEFVDRVAENSGLGKGEAAKAVDAVLESIQEVLSRGGDISFTGFGKFSVADRSARQGVNPQTGEKIQIAASRVPRFSAGSSLKSAVKGGV
jgi:DNA-binding protein HU-beta